MKTYIFIFIMSMLPILELRGAIPYGVSMGVSPLVSTLIAALGNAIIVPILYFLLKPVFSFLKAITFFTKLIEKYEERAANKLKKYEKFLFLGLILLVGIPLPTTGVYTGVVASHVLRLNAKTAITANIIGVIMSASIVFLLTTGILHIL